MKKRFCVRALGLVALVSAMACSQDNGASRSSLTAPTPASPAVRGNGIPEGYKLEFNWNLIGTPNEDYKGGCGDGHRIFVERGIQNAKLLITDPSGILTGSGWSIVDCNATGGNLAEIQSDDVGTFVVYARILGKPGGNIHVCAEVAETADDVLCELGMIDLTRGKQSKFQLQPNSLFDASLEDILWTVDTNKDFRIVQFRVYRVPTS